jgi:hypothetical protein
MAVVIVAQTGLSVSANSKSTDQVTGTYQFIPASGTVTVYARSSATGMNLQVYVNGQALMNDQPIPFFGATGSLTKNDHEVASFDVEAGDRIEFFARNTTGGALTVDFSLDLDN